MILWSIKYLKFTYTRVNVLGTLLTGIAYGHQKSLRDMKYYIPNFGIN